MRASIYAMSYLRISIVRISVVLNICLLFYLGLMWMSANPLEKVSRSPFNFLFTSYEVGGHLNFTSKLGLTNSSESLSPSAIDSAVTSKLKDPKVDAVNNDSSNKEEESGDNKEEISEPPREVQESPVPTIVEEAIVDPPLDSLEKKIYPDLKGCPYRSLTSLFAQRSDYWVLNNYIPAALMFRCDESVTYTTHGEYTFLENLDPLTSRWQGPVSIAVFAPGSDFAAAIETILYLRECWGEGIKKFVTFHLIFPVNHLPKKVPSTEELLQQKPECSNEPPKWNITTFKQRHNLTYPINVARNVARLNAQTYFVFPSDIELYPSVNFVPEFFKMLKRPDVSGTTNPRVYVFPIFEVAEEIPPPETKAELQKHLSSGKAIPFHKKICPMCHGQPKSAEWEKANASSGLSVFHVGKRKGKHRKWEPIYVGTNKEPIYDERLTWEGKSDKMTQMYILCVRDYELHILDNAFLVHRPGIKSFHKDKSREKLVSKQSMLISKKILPEYKQIFGSRDGCTV